MDNKYKILLIDDEQEQIEYLKKYLDTGLEKWIEPIETFLAYDEEQLNIALEKIGEDYYDAIISDLYMPDSETNGLGGIRIIEKVKKINEGEDKNLLLIVISNKPDAGRKVEPCEINNPAWFKFYSKASPPSTPGTKYEDSEIWLYALSHAILKLNKDQDESADKLKAGDIIGQSESINKLRDMISRCASTPASVLITGESGTGKELIAKAIHYQNNGSDKPFISVNCGAIPENLIESELFGYEKGAFTGAVQQRKGAFESAKGGTLFFDEIGELPSASQAKLLRALQERKIQRIGGTKEIEIDARFIFATNKDILKEVREGRFREDLYYRLNVVPISMPPLRERRDDISLLINHFLDDFAKQSEAYKGKSFSGTSLQRLLAYDWPGNVRELRNVIERCLTLSKTAMILEQDLPEEMRSSTDQILQTQKDVVPEAEMPAVSDQQILDRAKKGIDRWSAAAENLGVTPEVFKNSLKTFIGKIYAQKDKNKTKTAQFLNMRRATLHDWMKKLQIN